MRVLIVSEVAAERSRARSALALQFDDVEVVEATSARETRQLLVNTSFDVLVVDGDLRPQGGFSLLYELREAAEQLGTVAAPGVVLVERQLDQWLATWSGAAGVLTKPVDPFELARTIKAIVGQPV